MSAAVEWRTLIVVELLIDEGQLSPPTVTAIRLMAVTTLCCPELKLHLITDDNNNTSAGYWDFTSSP